MVSTTGWPGPHPERLTALTQVRPVLFGVAWKVLDLQMELAFAQLATPNQTKWRIEEKSAHARAFRGSLAGLTDDPEIWMRICLIYTGTTEARHALTHRRLQVDAHGAFVNLSGAHQTLTAAEQDAMQGLALSSSTIALHQNRTRRDGLMLGRFLNALTSLHGRPALPASTDDQWKVVVNSELIHGRWSFHARSIFARAREAAPTSSHFDVEIHLAGSGLAPVVGALTVAAEAGVMDFDPSVPEIWMNP